MPTYSIVFHQIRSALAGLYDSGEAIAIAREVMTEVTGITYSQSLVLSDTELMPKQEVRIGTILEQMQQGMPMQYALGNACFMGKKYMVNKHVLIPRPETEELVQWVIDDWTDSQIGLNILDVGAGSGCIPISLKSGLGDASVITIDISQDALGVAEVNAKEIGVHIQLEQLDFLDTISRERLDSYDVIISNPPYVPESEEATLDVHVREWEPHAALFVADNDPLVFYRAIATFGKDHLAEDGAIYCELHADYSKPAKLMFEAAGYEVQLRKDIAGNWRMLKAWR